MWSFLTCALVLVGFAGALPIASQNGDVTANHIWSYQDGSNLGPSRWPKFFPTCNGTRQSPVSIQTISCHPLDHPEIGYIISNFLLFDDYAHMSVHNTGHTVTLKVTKEESDGAVIQPSPYKLHAMHFHWGSPGKPGSEHTIDGKANPMELHIVHYARKYKSFEDAAKAPDGLAVLGVLIEVGFHNDAIQHIVDELRNIKYMGYESPVVTFAVDLLLPRDTSLHYVYDGSLTTPPCYESVKWTVFKNSIQISAEQLAAFQRQVKANNYGDKDEELADNCRPTQALNTRTVQYSGLPWVRPIG